MKLTEKGELSVTGQNKIEYYLTLGMANKRSTPESFMSFWKSSRSSVTGSKIEFQILVSLKNRTLQRSVNFYRPVESRLTTSSPSTWPRNCQRQRASCVSGSRQRFFTLDQRPH